MKRVSLQDIPYRYHELPQDARGRTIWTCVACGKSDVWRDGWRRYGSFLMDDEGGCISVVCSDACQTRIEAR